MKATGIIRCIDDLGRIIVPKEIRRTLKIKEGDPFEIFVIDGMVCFKKYSAEDSHKEELTDMVNTIKEEYYHIKNPAQLIKKLEEALDLLKDGRKQ